MKRVITTAIALSVGLAHGATAQESPAGPCDQIRAQIKEHKGIPAKPNTELLGRIGANNQCRFTSAEVYRAAWGDTPFRRPGLANVATESMTTTIDCRCPGVTH